MKTLLATLAIIITAAQSFADITPPVRWDVETGRLEPRPFTLSIRRGESLKIEPRFLSYDAPINLSGAAVEMRYATSYNMATHYSATGSVQATTGRVQIAWSDSLNPTNNSMYYEIRATSGTQILARAYGPLRFLGGMVGLNTGLVARTSLDWATVSQVNGTAVLSNQMGSGATWTGSNWTFAAGSSGISAATATGIVTGIAYPLSSNPSNYCTIFAATNGLGGYVPTNDARVINSTTNVSGGILTWASGVISLTQAAISNAVAGVYSLVGHIHDWTVITGLGTAATNSAGAFATTGQGALADATATNTLDLAGTRLMTGDSVTLARDVKSRDAVTVGLYGVALGSDTLAGLGGAAFGVSTIAGSYGAAFGFGTTAGAYGFAAGNRGFGALGAFAFADSIDANFDRTAYTNWFSVRASGGTYFATPDLTATGTITALSFNGSSSSLTGCPLGASPTGHPHDAAAITNLASTVAGYGYLTNVSGAAIAAAGGVTNGGATVNGSPITNGAAIVVSGGGFTNYIPAYILGSTPTVSVTRAMGELVKLTCTSAVTLLTIDNTGWDTNGAGRVTIDLYGNNNSIGFDTTVITNSTLLDISTNANVCTPLFFRRPTGGTIWRVRQ